MTLLLAVMLNAAPLAAGVTGDAAGQVGGAPVPQLTVTWKLYPFWEVSVPLKVAGWFTSTVCTGFETDTEKSETCKVTCCWWVVVCGSAPVATRLKVKSPPVGLLAVMLKAAPPAVGVTVVGVQVAGAPLPQVTVTELLYPLIAVSVPLKVAVCFAGTVCTGLETETVKSPLAGSKTSSVTLCAGRVKLMALEEKLISLK